METPPQIIYLTVIFCHLRAQVVASLPAMTFVFLLACRSPEYGMPSVTFGSVHPSDVLDMPVDPNEPTYCLCHQVSYGEMIGCDNPDVRTVCLRIGEEL